MRICDNYSCRGGNYILNRLKDFVEDEILSNVTKPLRYVGNEYNVVKKEWESVKLRTLFAFPDLYEVGMSHLGMRILYHLVNEQKDYLMERVFAPWTDMEQILRERKIPLFSLESYHPIKEFDCIGFTLQYEMSYTNILNMLDLGGIPLEAAQRSNDDPLIMAGGPCTCNPEPLADFFDFFVIGEGENVILEVLQTITEHRQKREGKQEKHILLHNLAQIPGVYVPVFYEDKYNEDGSFRETKVEEQGIAPRVVKRTIKDLDESYFPLKPIVPYIEIVHDRIMLEVLRGCTRGCRFCQAGMIYRPVRERSKELLVKQAEELVTTTGYNEISLTSLSTSDHSTVKELVNDLTEKYKEDRIGVSLPSLRVDSFSMDLAKEIQQVRKTGLTFAPEAGTQRLRDVINKGVTEENLMEVTDSAFKAGWSHIKLYFMLGLPTETFEDLDGIVDLAYKVLRKGIDIMKEQKRGRQPKVTISVSSFVPKPHTPFQWEPQDILEVLQEKQRYIKDKIRDRRIVYNYHDAPLSFLEAVFAKGDRRLGQVLKKAWEGGCKFDSWTEHFQYNVWQQVFEECKYDPQKIAYRRGEFTDDLPWDHLDMGVSKKFLWRERDRAYEAAVTGDCRFNNCSVCGVCQNLDVQLMIRKDEKGR